MYTSSNAVARKIKTITKQRENEKLFLATVFDFVYIINALVLSVIALADYSTEEKKSCLLS